MKRVNTGGQCFVSEQQIERATYSVDEAAKALGISRNLAYDGVRSGEIPCIRIRGRILVPRAAIERMLSGQGTEQVSLASAR